MLNASADVWRFTRMDDGMGGYSEQWAKISTVRARYSQPTATERVAADQSESRLTHVVYVDPGADLRRSDELRNSGRTYEVLAVFEPSMPGTYLRADCWAHQPEK
jgi:SPP1 family predicted phage head-tail adaptor